MIMYLVCGETVIPTQVCLTPKSLFLVLFHILYLETINTVRELDLKFCLIVLITCQSAITGKSVVVFHYILTSHSKIIHFIIQLYHLAHSLHMLFCDS